MRQRYRRLVGAACCVGAIGVIAALLLSGQGAGADQNDQGNRPGTGHAKTHGPPSGRGHGSLHPSGWASASGSPSGSGSGSAHVAPAAHGSTPAGVARPTAQPSAWTNPAPNSAVAPVPAARTTITLQGMRSLPPASGPVRHPTGQPARIVDVAAAPATPTHDSVVLAATLSGLLFAVGVVALTYGYRPGRRDGRHRSA